MNSEDKHDIKMLTEPHILLGVCATFICMCLGYANTSIVLINSLHRVTV